jgi:hypothetical protein
LATQRSENFLPYRDLNYDPSVTQAVAIRYIDYAIPASVLNVTPLINFSEAETALALFIENCGNLLS